MPTPLLVLWLDKAEWGTVPAWFGGLSLLLAFVLFFRDRRRDDREQIDKVAIWLTTAYEPQFFGADGKIDRIEEVEYTLHTKNANDVPIDVHAVAFDIRTWWTVPQEHPRHDDGTPVAYLYEPGTVPNRHFTGRFLLPPDGSLPEQAQKTHIGHHAPESATQLAPADGVRANVRWFLAIDNAGRRWEVRPGIGKRARRIRWYSRRRAYYPSGWQHPIFHPLAVQYYRIRERVRRRCVT